MLSLSGVATLNNLLFHVYSSSMYILLCPNFIATEGHERSYLIGELESLGLSSIKINQIMKEGDDNKEAQV